MNPFDFLESINNTKKNLLSEQGSETAYVPFIVNRSLSQFPDTVLYANEINTRQFISKEQQYLFYLYSVRKRKRFSGKWVKPEQNDEVSMIMEYYGYSHQKAMEVYPLFTKEAILDIKRKTEKGGK